MIKKTSFSFVALLAFVLLFTITSCNGGDKPQGTLVDPSQIEVFEKGDSVTAEVPIIAAQEYDRTYKACNDSMKTVKRQKAVKDTVRVSYLAQGKQVNLKDKLDANGMVIVKKGDVITAKANADTAVAKPVNHSNGNQQNAVKTTAQDDSKSSRWWEKLSLGWILWLLLLVLGIGLIVLAAVGMAKLIKWLFNLPVANNGGSAQQDRPVVQQTTVAEQQNAANRIHLTGLHKRFYPDSPLDHVKETIIVEKTTTEKTTTHKY